MEKAQFQTHHIGRTPRGIVGGYCPADADLLVFIGLQSCVLEHSEILRKETCRRAVRQSNIERSESGREGSCRWALCQSDIERSESGREGSDLDGRCLKIRPLMVRGGVRPPRNGTNPNLAMGRGSRKNNNPYPKASRISVATPVS